MNLFRLGSLLLAALCAFLPAGKASAQTGGLNIVNGVIDFGSAGHTPVMKIVANVAALPATGCKAGEVAMILSPQGIYQNSTNGSCTWATASNPGTVTSVSFTGGLISVATPTTMPAFTVAGTSGGIPYFSSASTWASSAAGTAGHLMLWGGAGSAPTDGGAPPAAGANTALSNLSTVSINAALGFQTGIAVGTTTNPAKNLVFNASGTYGTASYTFAGTPTANRALTIPDASDTFAMLGATNAFTAVNSFKSAGTTPSVANMPFVVKDSAGSTIAYIGPNAAGQFGFWPGSVTPSTTNYTMQSDGTYVILNAPGNGIIYLRRNNNDVMVLDGGAGNATLNAKFTSYNNIATVDQGIPFQVAHKDLTAQTAAISAAALYTPVATGRFRITYYAKVTTPGTTSILGGTTGFQVAYTDGTDSVAQTGFTLPADDQTGTAISIGTGNVTNTTQAVVQGSAFIYAKTGVAMTYSFGYSSTGTAMQYELHVTVEAM